MEFDVRLDDHFYRRALRDAANTPCHERFFIFEHLEINPAALFSDSGVNRGTLSGRSRCPRSIHAMIISVDTRERFLSRFSAYYCFRDRLENKVDHEEDHVDREQ